MNCVACGKIIDTQTQEWLNVSADKGTKRESMHPVHTSCYEILMEEVSKRSKEL